jgi:hypothetical protein
MDGEDESWKEGCEVSSDENRVQAGDVRSELNGLKNGWNSLGSGMCAVLMVDQIGEDEQLETTKGG